MEPLSATSVALVKAQALDPAVQEFAEDVTGAGRRELGEWFADHIRLRRWKAQLSILVQAREFAADAGFSPHAVPLKTLVPLLEGASLEANDAVDMPRRWAALLANASRDAARVPPSFPEILRQLAPAEARLLDLVYDEAVQHPMSEWLRTGVRVIGAAHQLDLAVEFALLSADNLIRLRLASPPAASFGFSTRPGRKFLIASGEDVLCLTRMGASFVSACRAPTAQ